jgi:hypothetical protein
MALFTCTNCGYSIDNIHPGEDDLSCPGCRHRIETDGDQDSEIQEQDHIFFEELMSGQTAEQFHPDELIEQSDIEWTPVRSPAEVQASPRHYSPEFHGSAGAYFRVWIVNVFLSVMTLGIFMVWGKKRVRKYFSNKIVIDGHPLDSVTDYENIYEHITECCPGNVRVGNLTINNTAKASKLFWIRFSNILLGILSLGLLVPWAKVRRVRYIVRSITVITDREIDGFVADSGKQNV